MRFRTMRARGLLLALFLLVLPSLAAAQTCPGFPARGAQIIDALAPRYPGGTLSGTDDQRRELTRAILEQFVYEMPADGWTWKSADPGRPPSKDSLSRLVAGRLCNWDWQNGSTRQRAVQPGQLGDDITGQNPIPVAGVNHLTDVPVVVPPVVAPPSQPPPVYIQPAVDLSQFLTRDAAERMFADLVNRDERLVRLNQELAAQLKKHDEQPTWAARVFGNRYVQMLLAGAGTLVTREIAK